MSKLKYNSTPISSEVLSSISSTINNLNTLVSKNNAMYIPNDFVYFDLMNGYRADMNSVKQDFSNKQIYLENANKNMDSVVNKMREDLLAINQVDTKSVNNIL